MPFGLCHLKLPSLIFFFMLNKAFLAMSVTRNDFRFSHTSYKRICDLVYFVYCATSLIAHIESLSWCEAAVVDVMGLCRGVRLLV